MHHVVKNIMMRHLRVVRRSRQRKQQEVLLMVIHPKQEKRVVNHIIIDPVYDYVVVAGAFLGSIANNNEAKFREYLL